MFSFNSLFKINYTLTTVTIESEYVEVIIFPGKIGVATIEGKHLNKNSETSSNDLYVCGEDSVHILLNKIFTKDKENKRLHTKDMRRSIRNIMNLSDIVSQLGTDAYQVVIQRDVSDQLPSTFVPMTVILGRLFQCIHMVIDNTTKLELSNFISTCTNKIMEYFPKLSNINNNLKNSMNSPTRPYRRMSLQDLNRPLLTRSRTAPTTPTYSHNKNEIPKLQLDNLNLSIETKVDTPSHMGKEKVPPLALNIPSRSRVESEDITDYYVDLKPTIVRNNSKNSPNSLSKEKIYDNSSADEKEILIFSDDEYESSDSDNNFDDINSITDSQKDKDISIGSKHYYIVDKRLLDKAEQESPHKKRQDLSEQFCGSTPRLQKIKELKEDLSEQFCGNTPRLQKIIDPNISPSKVNMNNNSNNNANCAWLLTAPITTATNNNNDNNNTKGEDEINYANYIEYDGEEEDDDDNTEVDVKKNTHINSVSNIDSPSSNSNKRRHRRSFPSIDEMDLIENHSPHWSATACTTIPSVSNTVKSFFTNSPKHTSAPNSRKSSFSDENLNLPLQTLQQPIDYHFSVDELPMTPKGSRSSSTDSPRGNQMKTLSREFSFNERNVKEKNRKSIDSMVYSSNVKNWTIYNKSTLQNEIS